MQRCETHPTGGLELSAECHPGEYLFVVYHSTGVLQLACVDCGKHVTSIAVKKGEPEEESASEAYMRAGMSGTLDPLRGQAVYDTKLPMEATPEPLELPLPKEVQDHIEAHGGPIRITTRFEIIEARVRFYCESCGPPIVERLLSELEEDYKLTMHLEQEGETSQTKMDANTIAKMENVLMAQGRQMVASFEDVTAAVTGEKVTVLELEFRAVSDGTKRAHVRIKVEAETS